jgi:2',3'-cyclic-nucleotide 2'-phosphodiesterase (5'-nucleotidase family)
MTKRTFHICFSTSILLIFMSLGCVHTYKVIEYKSTNETVNVDFSTRDSLFPFVKNYKIKLDETMNQVICTTAVDLEIGNPEGLLGNFIADIVLQEGRLRSQETIDFCVLNNGGLRKPLLKGPITKGDVFEVMPFENELIVLELSGEKVAEFAEFVYKKSMLEDARKAGVPVSGIRITLDQKGVQEVRVGLLTLDKKKSYRVLTSDYLAGGGDQMSFFINPISFKSLHLKLRDAMMNAIVDLGKNNIQINAQLDGRIRIQK